MPSFDHDRWENTAWTVNGKIGPLKAIYTGGYMDRHISQQMDYTNYSRSAGGMYYQCTGGGTGWGGNAFCYSPVGYWDDSVRNTHLTNEVRVSTPDDWRARAIVGAYYEQFKIYDDQNFNYKTIPSCTPANLAAAMLPGGAPCVADVHTAPGSTANNPGIRADNTAFGEDTQRGYNQFALFGSFDFDIIPNVLTVTAGTRYYKYDEFEVGSQYGTTTGCLDVPNGQCVGGLVNINAANDKVTYTGFKSRANITWHIQPNLMVYYTFSQGFRPGGFNRSVSAVAPLTTAKSTAQYEKPNGYAPDSLTNNEIGLKTEFLDNRVQLNLSAYYMNWDNVQFLFFDPTQLGNTTFGVNGPNYNVKGVEGQLVARVTDALTVQGSMSYDDDTQANSPCLMDNIAGTPAFGQCITGGEGRAVPEPLRQRRLDPGLLAEAAGQSARPLRLADFGLQALRPGGPELHGQHVQPAGHLPVRQRRADPQHHLPALPAAGLHHLRRLGGRHQGPLVGDPVRHEPEQLPRQPVHLLGAVHQVGSPAAADGDRAEAGRQLLAELSQTGLIQAGVIVRLVSFQRP